MEIECLYEDTELFVLNKPSGLLVHRGWAKDEITLVDFARHRTPTGTAHPIQRLDRGASGAVIFAKSAAVARLLSLQMQEGSCHKSYIAVVRGELQATLDIDYPINRKEDGPKVPSRTLVEPIAIAETAPRSVSLVKAMPLTGRLHQIRRHLKHVNHPLIGDVLHGQGVLNRAFRETYGLMRLALHAYEWSIRHPSTNALLRGLVQAPDDLLVPLIRMGFERDKIPTSTEVMVEASK